MADEQIPPNPSDDPVGAPSPSDETPAPGDARPDVDKIEETIAKSEDAAKTLASEVEKGPVTETLSAKANDMLAAAKAAIAAAQTHQDSGGGPMLGATQPDLSDMTGASGGAPVSLPDFSAAPASHSPGARDIDLLADVNLNVNIELGRTRMLVEDVLRLGEGSVVELDKLAGDPVDVFVNGRHVARGEVLVVNDNFCVRISEILSRVPGSDD